MLKEKINADYMAAFKARDTEKKNLLSVIKGGIELGEKILMVENMPDDKVLEVLTQAAKASRETISKLEEGALKDFAKRELAIIESYLPKQLSEEEVTKKIDEFIAGGAGNIAEIMRAFSGLPVDRQMVANIFRSKNS